MFAVKAEGIYKHFKEGAHGKKEVLKNVSIDIEEGEIFGILGPNGAGKTTLISILATLTIPDGGKIRIFGLDTLAEANRVKSIVNISSGNPNFPWSLTVYENLRYFSMLYGLKNKEKSINNVISMLELEPFRNARFDSLSTGTKQRLSLAKALLNEPRLLFLDEPTMGLDPDMSIKIRRLIKRIHEEKEITIVLTTHYMKEAEELCGRIAFIKKGEIIANATPGELKRQMKLGETITIDYEGRFDIAVLKDINGILDIVHEDGKIKLVAENVESIIDNVLKKFCEVHIKNIEISQPNLEDVFLKLAR
ncbi:MAG: ABC transporter ATP-binding protein [Candidatus Methanoperedens sp.]|nr:ABC transporter ATP-binding protein [Candidatus Methanoperedens sp.]MCZ7370817.1 ABC transporter ATP-binding protein [Candidatus Methanoperedens sp.]